MRVLTSAVTLGSGLVVAGLLAGQIASLGPGNEVCVDVTGFSFSPPVSSPPVEAGVRVAGATATRLCDGTPSFGQQLALAGIRLSWPLFGFAAVALFAAVLRGISQHGAFVAVVAKRLFVLGVFLVIGSLAAALVQSGATALLTSSMAPEAASAWLRLDEVPWFGLLTGLGVIAVARILRLGKTMREDLEGTV
ncbi:hypothetical protein [Amycolatopsis magusensis]|uniref:hypothetical protein n=1 Tax=Amycolatopsis magusensis TaxID=882444 RepID=UPI0024A9929F|nr:hypothetical protein [Amycolatopsis magusensis]MDI5979827.1 hypothetical protein [Amycolatopsis magusensis]